MLREGAINAGIETQFSPTVVAGSFVSRGRSFAQLSAYAEAGIDR